MRQCGDNNNTRTLSLGQFTAYTWFTAHSWLHLDLSTAKLNGTHCPFLCSNSAWQFRDKIQINSRMRLQEQMFTTKKKTNKYSKYSSSLWTPVLAFHYYSSWNLLSLLHACTCIQYVTWLHITIQYNNNVLSYFGAQLQIAHELLNSTLILWWW